MNLKVIEWVLRRMGHDVGKSDVMKTMIGFNTFFRISWFPPTTGKPIIKYLAMQLPDGTGIITVIGKVHDTILKEEAKYANV